MGWFHGMSMLFSAMVLKNGKASQASIIANMKETTTVRSEPAKNCAISWLRREPIVFRMPTSLARFSLRAVLRFMKLIQANNKMKTPVRPNIVTYLIAPPVFTPSLNSPYRCQLLIGCRNSAGFFFCNCSLTFLSLASFILAEMPAKSAGSLTWTNSVVKLGRQGSSMSLKLPLMRYKKSQEAITSSLYSVVLRGKSLYTPETLSGSCLSICNSLPMGWSSPKHAFAADADISTEEGSLSPSCLPSSIESENIPGISFSK